MSSGGWIILVVADVVAIKAGFLSDELKKGRHFYVYLKEVMYKCKKFFFFKIHCRKD